MSDDSVIEQAEAILRKINWIQEILNTAQECTQDNQTADILSGVSFIIKSASNDAENLYRALR